MMSSLQEQQVGTNWLRVTWTWLCLILSVSLVLLPPVPRIHAQQAYTGLDILFLVDQSGGMGGSDFDNEGRQPPTDPAGIRFSATEFALDWLGNYHASFMDQETRPTINVAALFFGGEPADSIFTPDQFVETMLDWYTIEAESSARWQNERNTVVNAVSEDTFVGQRRAAGQVRNLGNTNFREAFRQAFRLYAAQPNPDHLQVIVILTDGAPCAPASFARFSEQSKFCSDSSFRAERDHMNQLLNEVEAQFSADNQRIYAVLLNNPVAPVNTYNGYEGDWQAITRIQGDAPGGGYFEVTNPVEIGPQFNEILIEVTNALNLPSANRTLRQTLTIADGENRFQLEPYTKSLRVTLYSSSGESDLRFTLPGNARLPATIRPIGGNTPIEVWTIEESLIPGTWGVEALLNDSERRDTSATVAIEQIPADLQVQFPDRVQQYTPFTLRYWFLDARGAPINNQAYGNNVATPAPTLLFAPNAAESANPIILRNARRDAIEPGIYRLEHVPTTAGEFRATLNASIQRNDGTTISLGRREGRIEVARTDFVVSLDGVDLVEEGESNQPGTVLGTTVPATLRFVDDRGQLVPNVDLREFAMSVVEPQDEPCVQRPVSNYEENPPQQYRTSVQISQLGTNVICLFVQVADNQVLYDGQYATLIVEPGGEVYFEITEPTDAVTRQDRSLWPRLQWPPFTYAGPEALTISIEAFTQPSQPIPLRDYVIDDDELNSLFSVATYRDNNRTELLSRSEPTVSNAEGSAWQVEIPMPSELGDYVVQVVPGEQQQIGQSSFVISDTNRSEVALSLQRNVLSYQLEWVLWGFVILFGVVIVFIFVLRPVYYVFTGTLNPLRGVLQVLRIPQSDEVLPGHSLTNAQIKDYNYTNDDGREPTFMLEGLEAEVHQADIRMPLMPPLNYIRVESTGIKGLRQKNEMKLEYYVNGQKNETMLSFNRVYFIKGLSDDKEYNYAFYWHMGGASEPRPSKEGRSMGAQPMNEAVTE